VGCLRGLGIVTFWESRHRMSPAPYGAGRTGGMMVAAEAPSPAVAADCVERRNQGCTNLR
jgi:lysophospholipid acyltransferase (LPLAT)-like uncharacterized protein